MIASTPVRFASLAITALVEGAATVRCPDTGRDQDAPMVGAAFPIGPLTGNPSGRVLRDACEASRTMTCDDPG